MADVLVRKAHAGSDSFGHVWERDGDVVEMPYEQAAELVAIPTAGCTIVDPPVDEPVADSDEPATVERTEIDEAPPHSELGPDAEQRTEVNEAPATRRRGRPRKNSDIEE